MPPLIPIVAEPGHFPGAKGLPLRQFYLSGQRHVPNIGSNWDACRKTQVKFAIVYFRTSFFEQWYHEILSFLKASPLPCLWSTSVRVSRTLEGQIFDSPD